MHSRNGTKMSEYTVNEEESEEQTLLVRLKLTKESTDEVAINYYYKVMKPNEKRLRDMVKKQNTKIKDAAIEGITCQLKKDFSSMILHHPAACVTLKEDVATRLWQTCFYIQISKLKGLVETASKKLRRALKGEYQQLISKGQDFYKSFCSKIDTHLLELNTALEANEVIEGVWTKSLFAGYLARGDLFRYAEDKNAPNERTYSSADGCYEQASALCPDEGHPLNQKATLALYRGDYLVAIAHYIRAIMIKHPFSTAKVNMKLLIERHILDKSSFQTNLGVIEKAAQTVAATGGLMKLTKSFINFILHIFSEQLLSPKLQLFPLNDEHMKHLKSGTRIVMERGTIRLKTFEHMAVLAIYTLETFSGDDQGLMRITSVLETVVTAGLESIKSTLDEKPLKIQKYSGLTCFISILCDYFSTAPHLMSFLDSKIWNAHSLRSLSQNAPVTALTARCGLKEEKDLSEFLPLRDLYSQFVKRTLPGKFINEKHSMPYRARKIVSFCESLQLIQSSSDSVAPGFSTEVDGEEILLQPSPNVEFTSLADTRERKGSLMKGLEHSGNGINHQQEMEVEYEQGLLTGYGQDSDDNIFVCEPHNSAASIQPFVVDDNLPPPGFDRD